MNRGDMSKQIGRPPMKKKDKKGYMGGGPVAYRDGGRVRRSDGRAVMDRGDMSKPLYLSELAPTESPRPRNRLERLAPATSPRPRARSEAAAEQFQRGMNRLLEEEERTTRPGKAASKPKKFAKGGKVDQMQCSPRKQAAMGGRSK